jgi:flagellar hook-associated protein 3 FlgL
MRVTASTYTNLAISSSQSAQTQLAQLQQEISTGNSIQSPSDDPALYSQAAQDQSTLNQLNAYTQAAATATTMTAQNNTAMTSLHQVVAQAGEYLAGVSTNMTTAQLQNVGTELQGLVTQLTSIVNQKSSDGSYLFGGTANVAPITSSGTYNTGTNGNTTTIDVQSNNPVQVTIAAGSSGPPAIDGFLYDSASGTDVLGALQQAMTDLNSGNASAVLSNDVPAVNKALNLISSYVGSTAASMSAVSTATTQLSQQTTSEQTTINGLVQTNLPTASVQLQQLEMQYQASLEAATRVMNLSILNYMSQVTTPA